MNIKSAAQLQVDNKTQIQPSHFEEFDRLMKALKDNTGFQLIIIEFNDPVYRDTLIGEITQSIEHPTITIDLSSDKYPNFYAFEESLKILSKTNNIIHVKNFERWNVFKDSKTMFKGFNYHRDFIAMICQTNLLLWMIEPDIKSFIINAPDMWSWRSCVSNFSYEKKILKDIGEMAIPLSESGLIGSLSLQAKKERIDEIRQFLNERSDTTSEVVKAKVINELGQLYFSVSDFEQAEKYFLKALSIRKEIGDKRGEGVTLTNIGNIFYARGDYDRALEYFQRSLKIRQEIGDKNGEGVTLNNISQILKARGDYDRALEYLQRSLKIFQEIGDKKNEGVTLTNIGNIYDARGDYDRALEYLQRSLKITQEIGDKSGEGVTLNNISQIFKARGDYDRALEYLQRSLKILQEIGDKSGMIPTLHNMAMIEKERENWEGFLNLEGQAYQLAMETGDAQGLFNVGWVLGEFLLQTPKREQGVQMLRQAYQAGRAAGFPDAEEVGRLLRELGE